MCEPFSKWCIDCKTVFFFNTGVRICKIHTYIHELQ